MQIVTMQTRLDNHFGVSELSLPSRTLLIGYYKGNHCMKPDIFRFKLIFTNKKTNYVNIASEIYFAFRVRLLSFRRISPTSLTYPPPEVYVYFLRYNSSLLVFKKCILLLCPKLLHPLQTTKYLLPVSYSHLQRF